MIVLLTVAIALMAIIVDRVIAVIFLQQQADATATTANNDTCTSNNSNTTCNNQYTNGYSNNTMPFILPFP